MDSLKKFNGKKFTREMALDVMEDTLQDIRNPHGRGVATGVCGGFYLSGLITYAEWQAFLKRIPQAVTLDEARSIVSGLTEDTAQALH